MNTEINDSVFNSFPHLETERLIFKEFKMSDAESLFDIQSNKQVIKYLDRDAHKTIDDSIEMLGEMIKVFDERRGIEWNITEKKSGKTIGYIGYWKLNKKNVRAEVGYALSPEFWGLGYASEALDKIIDFGFNDFHLHSIEANVNPGNQKSINLLEKLGFKKEAHFKEDFFYNGNFLDSAIYCLLETDYSKKELK